MCGVDRFASGFALRERKAGRGNRTLVFSLEGYCSTIELHPRRASQGGRAKPSNQNEDSAAQSGCRGRLPRQDWGVQDSNLRRHKPSDLQSDPFDRSGNSPFFSRFLGESECVVCRMRRYWKFESAGVLRLLLPAHRRATSGAVC